MKLGNLLVIVLIFLTSCATQRTTTIEGCDYDKNKNQTDYFVFPYGSVSIPGEWNKTTYNQIAKQQFFENSDSITIAIAFGPCNKYEFNTVNPKIGFEFVKAFYEWDSEFFVNNYHLEQELVESNENDNYIIWRVFGDNNNIYWDAYFLFGEKNGFANNFSVLTSDKWTKKEKVAFLKKIYLEEGTD